MENIWDLRKNQLCFSNASRSHPARHCWVFLCCIASFSSVSDTPKQGEAPIGCLSLLYTHAYARNYHAVPNMRR